MSSPHVAIVGATGAVGRELLAVLTARRFPIGRLTLLASARSAGTALEVAGETHRVVALCEEAFRGVDVAFFCAGGGISRELAPRAAELGVLVIDNSSAFRMDPDVPLVVPEVNPDAVAPALRREGGALIANPNCSTILLVVAIHAIHSAARVRSMVVSTYQAASGAGAAAMAELEQQTRAVLDGGDPEPEVFAERCAFNLFSHDSPIGPQGYNEEEMKMVREVRKIWDDPSVRVSATCVRVPVPRAHAESVHLELERPLSREEATELLEEAPGVRVVDDRDGNRFPTPLAASHRDEVLVGRIRTSLDDERRLELFLCGDQLRKGAALNAVQIAELVPAVAR